MVKSKGLDPIHVKKAKGVHIYDENDKRYIDFSSPGPHDSRYLFDDFIKMIKSE